MQCHARVDNRQCKRNGQWHHWPMPINRIKLAGFYSCLCTQHLKLAKEDLQLSLWVPPRTNLDNEVQKVEYEEELYIATEILKQGIKDAAKDSPLAQAMINKTNTRRLASGRIVELTPNGKAMKAVINHGDKPKGTPRIVGPRTRKLASGKIVNVDSNGKVIW